MAIKKCEKDLKNPEKFVENNKRYKPPPSLQAKEKVVKKL